MTPADIITAARSEIGTPFRHQGRLSGKALDCAGLIIHVARKLEIKYTDAGGYSRQPSNGLLESMLEMQGCLEQVSDMQPGDVLLMRFKEPQHLAIFAGDTIIHSYESVGKVCEHRLADVWRSRIVRVYRFVGVES